VAMGEIITNFGGNIQFTPAHFYAPTTQDEVLAILERHAHGKVRVVASRHAWSPAIVCDDALVDMRHFDSVTIERDADGNAWAIVGGGCRIKHLLQQLQKESLTMPSVGLITEQTIAGAISTATHGSGRHSLSHYMAEIRVAAYDAEGRARIYVWNEGPELQAARCALGCMGIILSVKFRCLPQYLLLESVRRYATLEEVLAQEAEHPLQQFFLIPHSWAIYAQQRRVLPPEGASRSWHATLYRIYWFVFIDLGLHLSIKLCAAWLRSRRLVHFLFRRFLPWTIWKPHNLAERSDVALTMEHELFRHLEIEIFVPARQLRQATAFVRAVVEVFDGAVGAPADAIAAPLESIGMSEELMQKRGTFTHHYPITFRRVLPDDALIAMSSGPSPPAPLPEGEGSWYAISFITYVEPRDAFYAFASFLARSMTKVFEARLHWGKYFPLVNADIEGAYPRLAEFRTICERVDPRGVFRNEFVERVLFGG
jgi:FAD/FMN-containing dehydrogenase